MTNDTTLEVTTSPEVEPEEIEDFSLEAPVRVSLKYLLLELHRMSKTDFEQWASDHWANVPRRFEDARRELRALERLGVANEVVEAKRARLDLWRVQIVEAMALAANDPEEPSLDYTEPITLKYFALWLWLCDHAPDADEDFTAHRAAMNASRGPIDWSAYLDADLLALPCFNGHA